MLYKVQVEMNSIIQSIPLYMDERRKTKMLVQIRIRLRWPGELQ
jgi:hypothetical protein